MTITNLRLNLCIEDNPVLSASVISKFESEGIKIRCDFLDCVNTPINSTSAQVALNIPQQAGTKLKRIIHCVFNSVQSGATSQDMANFAGDRTLANTPTCKVANIQTQMDSQPLQFSAVDCTFSDVNHVGNMDYQLNAKFTRNSVIQSLAMYMYNWFFCDDFSNGEKGLFDNKELAMIDAGLDLAKSRNYVVRLSTPNGGNTNLTLYSFIITSKVLHFGKDGVQWVF